MEKSRFEKVAKRIWTAFQWGIGTFGVFSIIGFFFTGGSPVGGMIFGAISGIIMFIYALGDDFRP